jgi:hypothetical protein
MALVPSANTAALCAPSEGHGSETFYVVIVQGAQCAWTDSGDVAVQDLGHERPGTLTSLRAAPCA